MGAPASQIELARAKINLTLHVGRPIADSSARFYGYHPLDSLVVFADTADEITAMPARETSLSISGPFAQALEGHQDNLILKAIEATAAQAAVPPLSIQLVKNLPVAAGVGGGSANAAAMLRLLQGYVDLPDKVWSDIALSLGADVPVCLLSRTAYMRGIGEDVQAVSGLGTLFALLVNPRVAVPTGAVFNTFDMQEGALAPQETPRPQRLSGSLLARALEGRNDLEAPAQEHGPIISDVLRALAAQPGAMLARMSGSGATCFALFERRSQAMEAAKTLTAVSPHWWVQAAVLGEDAA